MSPQTLRSIIKSEFKNGEPDPEINDEGCSDHIHRAPSVKLDKLQGFLDQNNFFDEKPLRSISSNGSELEIQKDEEIVEIKKIRKVQKKSNKGKAIPIVHQKIQAMLTRKMDG